MVSFSEICCTDAAGCGQSSCRTKHPSHTFTKSSIQSYFPMLENDSQPVINRKKIFRGICLALVPTGFSFVLVSHILGQLKAQFILTNAQVGYIGGAGLWGMAISLLTIRPFLGQSVLQPDSHRGFD